jgi:RHS repeat-associated protein
MAYCRFAAVGFARVGFGVVAALVSAGFAAVLAQDLRYPTRTISIVVANAAGGSVSYLYNALGQMIEKSGTLGTTILMQDEAGHLIGEYDGSGNLVQETVWLGDIPVATLRSNGSGGVNIFYVHTDHLNTPRKVSRPSDNQLEWRWDTDPFGTAAANQNPVGLGTFAYNLRFPVQMYQTETGLNQNYFRDFDPAVGRYVESDPVGLKSGINTYAFVGGNPIGEVDPFGLWGTEAHNAIIQALFPGLTWGQLLAVERGSAEVDSPTNQGPATAYQHAMRAPNQSAADAQRRMCAFVNGNLGTYRALFDSPNVVTQYNAYVALGRALHPIMDSTSPAHSGWQVWDEPLLHPGEIIPHGNGMGSIEGLNALTPALLQETLRRARDAMDGKGLCGCGGN